ncbi:hypothetical protein PENSPDRAFT_589762 [Peniophora sp. CONT]|nr:hypothetical protein PENSPDRAFT_589762 [Peniophora sp. CONT]
MTSMSSSSTSGAEKQPRSSRACVQCRTRKQRCLPELPGVPCQRCRSAHKTCSFETDVDYRLAYAPYPSPSPGQAGTDVHALRLEIAEHRRRLDILEGAMPMPAPALGSSPADSHIFSGRSMQYGSPVGSAGGSGSGSNASHDSPRPKMKIEDCTLEAPISTLRNLSTLRHAEDVATLRGVHLLNPHVPDSRVLDPVDRGILSMEDAELRATCSVLFTSICAVGARYWDHETPAAARAWLHPQYRALIGLLDEAISHLLLRATPVDVTVESIQALLVYLQWMPLDNGRSRYNDISAWSIAGLAIRHAHFIGLDRSVQASYDEAAREEDIHRMRVWLNLLSVDHHLMLTASLPASLNPDPAARVCRTFGAHPLAQPSDIKAAALCELVSIVHRAARACGDPSLRRLDPISLRRANSELDDWELTWTGTLPPQSTLYMPFTALRWYRLTMNCGSLNTFLTRPGISTASTSAAEIGIEAAAQMLFQFSAEAALQPAGRKVRGLKGPFTISHRALAAFQFAIDSYWVTHAFSVVLLGLTYSRGLIDDELNVLSPPAPKMCPRPDALLPCLLRLAAAAFRGVCAPGAAHYCVLVDGVLEDLLVEGQATGLVADVENMFPELLDLGLGFDWALFHDPVTGYSANMNMHNGLGS